MRIKGGFGWDYRSSDHRNLDGFRRMFLSTDHRNLNGIYTDFIELLRKKSLTRCCFARNESSEFKRMLNGYFFWGGVLRKKS